MRYNKLANTGILRYNFGEEKKKVRRVPAHPSGSVNARGNERLINQNIHEGDYVNMDVVRAWMPHMSLAPANSKGQALDAATTKKRYDTDPYWQPDVFTNPYQELDYRAIEYVTNNTIIGAVIDNFTKFEVGDGFRPELVLRNPKKDPEKNQKEIDANQGIVDDLMAIDEQLEVDDDNFHDVSWQTKVASAINIMNIYNRSALVFVYEDGNNIEIRGKKYNQIPTGIKVAHARDLGQIRISPDTWRLMGVQWRQIYNMIDAKDMIYLWNPIMTAKHQNAWWYGSSMVMPVIDAGRLLRQLVGVDFPAIAKNSWANPSMIVVNPQGQTIEEKREEYAEVVRGIIPGAMNALLENPEDVKFFSPTYDPKVSEFDGLMQSIVRYIVSSAGLPQSMFFDESQSNRATMLGKIQLAIATVLNPARDLISEQISAQWYQRWFRLLYKDTKPELYKKFEVKLRFKDLHVEQWTDTLEATTALDQRKPLKDESFGDIMNIENYPNMIDTDEMQKREQMQQQQQMQSQMPGGPAGAGGKGGQGGQGGQMPNMGKKPNMPNMPNLQNLPGQRNERPNPFAQKDKGEEKKVKLKDDLTEL